MKSISIGNIVIRYLLPLLAVGMFVLAVVYVLSQDSAESSQPATAPSSSPYPQTLSGAGIIEPKSENIEVASPVPGVVQQVLVEVGQRVEKGAALYRLDTRELQAELLVRQADLDVAQAKLSQLQAQPREEELPPLEAGVRAAAADVEAKKDSRDRAVRLGNDNALPAEDVVEAIQTYESARAMLQQAEAELSLKQAGAWKYDIASAEASVAQAQAAVDLIITQIDRRTVQASIAGTLLQINIEPGEFVATPPSQVHMILGDVTTLHARVDIDEFEIPRFQRNRPAQAVLRGNSEVSFPLRFVRVEPFVIPKQSLTGLSTERVDTRVLQVIYAFEETSENLFVGQQVDVYIEVDEAE